MSTAEEEQLADMSRQGCITEVVVTEIIRQRKPQG
jgi:hypothetical protein